ncbi:MAG: membrane integrity-associated transporter subunit PqiC [Desulfofustis sp.]|nr:membrane integrity-associated transporter subunit PqiC [Desulfofustis sp.]
MNRNLRLPGVVTLVLMAMLVTAGCGSAPPARFYALSSLADGDTRSRESAGQKRTVLGIGPIALAKYLEHPAITVRSGANTLNRSESNRWGGSLGDEVSRVMVENVSQLVSAEHYLVLPWLEPAGNDLRVQLTISQFEAISAQEVVLKGVWLLFEGPANNLLASGDFALAESLDGHDYPAITAAMSRALAELSRLIAGEIRKKGGTSDVRQ